MKNIEKQFLKNIPIWYNQTTRCESLASLIRSSETFTRFEEDDSGAPPGPTEANLCNATGLTLV